MTENRYEAAFYEWVELGDKLMERTEDWDNVFELWQGKTKEFEAAFPKAEKWDSIEELFALLTAEESVFPYISKLEAIKALVRKWREEIKIYPDTPEDQFAKVSVGLCINELNDVLEDSEFTPKGE